MAYNPLQQNILYSSNINNTPSNPGNNLEKLVNNPNNPHKNNKGIGKKLLLGGAIALLVAGGIVYALNPFNNETLPTPTPYTPPAVTTPAPTQTPIITETPSLEDKLPAYAPLSAAQIKEYTLTALQIAYDAHLAYEAKDYELSKKLVKLTDAWLDRALYALKVSNFDEERYWALRESTLEWMYGGSVPTGLMSDTREMAKRDAAEMAKNPDKETTIALIMRGLEQILGSRYGSEIK